MNTRKLVLRREALGVLTGRQLGGVVAGTIADVVHTLPCVSQRVCFVTENLSARGTCPSDMLLVCPDPQLTAPNCTGTCTTGVG